MKIQIKVGFPKKIKKQSENIHPYRQIKFTGKGIANYRLLRVFSRKFKLKVEDTRYKRKFLRKNMKILYSYRFFWKKKKSLLNWSVKRFYKQMLLLTKFFKNFVYFNQRKRQKSWKKFLVTKFKPTATFKFFSFLYFLEHRIDCILMNYFFSRNFKETLSIIKNGYIYCNFKKIINPYKFVQMGSLLQFSFFFLFFASVSFISRYHGEDWLNSTAFAFRSFKLYFKRKPYRSFTGFKVKNKRSRLLYKYDRNIIKKFSNNSRQLIEQNQKIQSIIFLQNQLIKNRFPKFNKRFCYGSICWRNKRNCCLKKGTKLKIIPFYILYEQKFYF